MPEQGGEIRGVRPQYDRHGMASHVDRACNSGVKQRSAVHLHELLGRSKSARAAGSQHDGMQRRGVFGATHPVVPVNGPPSEP